MSRVHELMLKINSSLDGQFGANIQRIVGGVNQTSQKFNELSESAKKIKDLELKVKGFDKVQSQMEKTREKNDLLSQQITQFRENLSNVSQGSNEYKEIEKAIKAMEKQQARVLVTQQRLEIESGNLSTQLNQEGVSTNRLGAERTRLANESRRLQGQIEDLTNTQRRNSNETRDQESKIGKLSGAMKGLAVGMAGYFGISQLKQYGGEAIALANEKIKAETDLQAMLKNTKYLQGDTTAITNASNMLKDYANQLETVGVIGDETVIAGQAQLSTFQLMPSSVKKLTAGMADMLAKNKGMNATQEDAAGLANLFGKVMSGQIGALSKYGVTLSKNQKKILETGKETERASMLAQILAENYGGANEALGKTDEGKMVIMRAEIEGIKEEFGKGLLPIQRQFFEVFKGQGPNISKILQTGLDVASKFFDLFQKMNPDKVFKNLYDAGIIAVDIIGKIVDKGILFIDWVSKGSDGVVILGGAVGGLATALGIYTTAVQISSGWAKISAWWTGISTTATGALTLKQIALNAVMSLNPIGAVIGLLVGLAVGLVYAYNNSENFRSIVQKLWEKMKDFGGYVVTLPEKLKGIWDGFISKTHELWEKIQSLMEPLKNAVGWVEKLFGGGNKTKNININTKTTTSGTGTPFTPYTGGIPKFAIGGVVDKPTIAEVGEGRVPETIIPHDNSKRSLALLQYTAQKMGVPLQGQGDEKKKNLFSTPSSSSVGTTVNNKTSSKQIIVKEIKVVIQGAGENLDKIAQKGKELAINIKRELEDVEESEKRLSIG